MNRKVNMGMILTAVFLLTGLLVFVGQAKAASDEWRSTWVVDADFVGNTPNVQLKVTVERNLGAGWFLYAEQVQPLDCRREGGVLLVNDTAVFEGNGSIKCAMPSLQGLVRQMTAGRYTPSATCDCKGNPMITSDVILAPNITGVNRENPLVSRMMPTGTTDMALAAPVPAFSTIPLASLLFAVGVETAQSNPFIASAMPNSLLATYFTVGDMHQAAFVANGADPGTGAGPVANLSVSNAATTLYIGYSPVTGDSLYGTLVNLSLDPGCYGTG